MFGDFVKFVRNIYETTGHIPLHAPHFCGNEKKYLNEERLYWHQHIFFLNCKK